MALTYYGIINLLFIGMLVFSGRIRKATEPWFITEDLNHRRVLLFIIAGVVIFTLCTTGIILMLKKYKPGFYLFLGGAVLVLVSDFFLLEFDWIRYLINTGFIFILGILHFTGICYRKRTDVGDYSSIKPDI